MFRLGDLVVYRMTKYSSHPTLRAVEVRPEPNGEFYTYDVLKYWMVTAIHTDGSLTVTTRRGKSRTVRGSDANLRQANWFERWFQAHRFPSPVNRQTTARQMPAVG
jgi:hypothetical protein